VKRKEGDRGLERTGTGEERGRENGDYIMYHDGFLACYWDDCFAIHLNIFSPYHPYIGHAKVSYHIIPSHPFPPIPSQPPLR
jgi:hypothetical protein